MDVIHPLHGWQYLKPRLGQQSETSSSDEGKYPDAICRTTATRQHTGSLKNNRAILLLSNLHICQKHTSKRANVMHS